MEATIKKFLKQLRLRESLMSTVLGLVVVVVAGTLLFNYFTKKSTTNLENFDQEKIDLETVEPVKPGEVQEGEKPQGLPTTHNVVKGEALWKIAETYYGSGYNFVDIAKENKLKSANVIEIGQELRIPDVQAKKQTISGVEQKITVVSAQTITADTHTVLPNDSLWSIAVRAYGDGFQWTKVYQANKDKIGTDPNRIEKGVELAIPR